MAAIFTRCPPWAILFCMNSSQKLIWSSGIGSSWEIVSSPSMVTSIVSHYKLMLFYIWMRSSKWFIRYCPYKLVGQPFYSKCSPSAILLFNRLYPKDKRIIRNAWRTTLHYLNVINPMFHKITWSQALENGHFEKWPFMALCQKIYMGKIAQAYGSYLGK